MMLEFDLKSKKKNKEIYSDSLIDRFPFFFCLINVSPEMKFTKICFLLIKLIIIIWSCFPNFFFDQDNCKSGMNVSDV